MSTFIMVLVYILVFLVLSYAIITLLKWNAETTNNFKNEIKRIRKEIDEKIRKEGK